MDGKRLGKLSWLEGIAKDKSKSTHSSRERKSNCQGEGRWGKESAGQRVQVLVRGMNKFYHVLKRQPGLTYPYHKNMRRDEHSFT